MQLKVGRSGILIVGVLVALFGVLGIGLVDGVSANQSSTCEARGRTLGQARRAYSNQCTQPRIDCDPIDGMWVCSSEQIGDAAPGRPKRVEPKPTTTVAPSTTAAPTATSPGVGSTIVVVPDITSAPDPTDAPTTATTAVTPTSSDAPGTSSPSTSPTTAVSATTSPTTAVSATTVPTTAAPATTSPTTAPPTTAPSTTAVQDPEPGDGHGGGHMAGPKPNVANGLPTGSVGSSDLQIVNRSPDTRSIPPNIATFRMDCNFSHMNFDDVIVKPGSPGKAHLHVYFGNTSVDALSDPMTLSEVGNSTCAGGRANRSAYWVPAVIDTNDGNRVLEPEGSIIYYKSGWAGGKPDKVVAPPNGLRVIAGDQANSERNTAPYYKRNINWACTQKGSISNNRLSDAFPTDCRPGELLVVRISFPQCWDGKNLDSPDHQSHMAYLTGSPNNRQDCPASHPVAIPRMSVNAYFKLRSTDTSGLRLASDGYDMSKPGGLSAHADWIVGWDQQILERVLDGCFRPADDCGHNNFNDGQGLLYPKR